MKGKELEDSCLVRYLCLVTCLNSMLKNKTKTLYVQTFFKTIL